MGHVVFARVSVHWSTPCNVPWPKDKGSSNSPFPLHTVPHYLRSTWRTSASTVSPCPLPTALTRPSHKLWGASLACEA